MYKEFSNDKSTQVDILFFNKNTQLEFNIALTDYDTDYFTSVIFHYGKTLSDKPSEAILEKRIEFTFTIDDTGNYFNLNKQYLDLKEKLEKDNKSLKDINVDDYTDDLTSFSERMFKILKLISITVKIFDDDKEKCTNFFKAKSPSFFRPFIFENALDNIDISSGVGYFTFVLNGLDNFKSGFVEFGYDSEGKMIFKKVPEFSTTYAVIIILSSTLVIILVLFAFYYFMSYRRYNTNSSVYKK